MGDRPRIATASLAGTRTSPIDEGTGVFDDDADGFTDLTLRHAEDVTVCHGIVPRVVRVILKNHNVCVKAAKDASALVDAALKKAESDVKSAGPALKKASELLKVIKTHNETYAKIKRDYAADLKNSKDAAKINKMIDVIAKAYVTTERKVRGAVTTIRKAA